MDYYKKFEEYTKFLLGTRYVLLRKEFLKYTGYHRNNPELARKILVTFGGSDPENITLDVIEMIKRIEIEDIEVIIVVGGANPHLDSLRNSIKNNQSISIRKNVNNMPELMAWADIAISAGGSSCWELAFMGTPSIVYPVADNQVPVVKSLEAQGMVMVFKPHDLKNPDIGSKIITELLVSPDTRNSFSQRLKQLVDGEGSDRVIMMINKHTIRLRPIRDEDCNLVYRWINDPLTRSQSFHTDIISHDEHKKWFNTAIRDESVVYYLAVDSSDCPIGQVRFTVKQEDAIISVLLDPKFRDKGLGSKLIRAATKKLFNTTHVLKVNAYIKTGNQYSVRAFTNAGYSNLGIITMENQEAYHLIMIRGD
jgi:RimJ/RimL family protein N-acetyltransferase